MVEASGGKQAFKLGAGDAAAHLAATLNRVVSVAQGERLVAVTWARSPVRDAAMRKTLFALVFKSHANLLRRWAEP